MATSGKVTEDDIFHFDFVSTLQRISDELTEKKTRLLKLYCSHLIPKGVAEGLPDAIDVFQKLIELDKIDPYNLEFLEEILRRIGRADLVRDVVRPFQSPEREIPENPELQPGTSTDGASPDDATSNVGLVVNGHKCMTQETVNHHKYNLRSLTGAGGSQVKFRGYKKHESILMHYTIPRESTAVLRLMADNSDPRLVFMGVKSLQIDAEAPIEVTRAELFNDIMRQRTVDDMEVGCIPRIKQQRAPRNRTRLSALNLFSDTLPLHLQIAESLEYPSIQKLRKANLGFKTVEKESREGTARGEGDAVVKGKEETTATTGSDRAGDEKEKLQTEQKHSTVAGAEGATRHATAASFQGGITYGGKGSEPGKFKEPRGIVVSCSNEIFAADRGNKRVQVHNTEGVYLRHFPTVLLGTKNNLISPSDVAMNGKGALVVVGKDDHQTELIAQYSTYGTALGQFELQKSKIYQRRVAVDLRNNHILVTDNERGEVQVFRPDGSPLRRFGHPQNEMTSPRYITVDREGNILVTDWDTRSVYMYNESGKFLLKFGGKGSGEGQFHNPSGICTDSIGNVIVADSGNGRVQMFTRHGEHVRTIKTGTRIGGVAVGPERQLVLTDLDSHSVTVLKFPNYL
ncbi:hypothetical protein Bbelb_163000 [Branchiostoma belcheri]|nr:hypothetical protein Bbelb_163000 [Branchiostoma belcheri]